MTDQPTGSGGVNPDDLTDEQRAILLAQAAQHTVSQPNPAADQAAAAAQMTERGPELPAESDMDRLMALIKAQSDQLASLTQQVGVMQKQADEAVAAQGGPPVTRLAQAAADKLAALAVAHPDLGPDHFAAPLAAVDELVNASKTLTKDGGSAEPVTTAAAKLDRWFTKTHWREGRKFIDFGAVAEDVERAVDEALKIAA